MQRLRPFPTLAALAVALPLMAQSPRAKAQTIEEIFFLVNDDIITRMDYQALEGNIRRQIERMQAGGQGDKAPKLVPTEIISNLILGSLIRQEAEKNGITVSGLDITNRMRQIASRNNLKGVEELEAALSREGIALSTFAENLRNQMYDENLTSRLSTMSEPSVDEVRGAYEKGKTGEFSVKTMSERAGRLMRVSQILLEADDKLSFSEKYKVKERGDRILADIKAGTLKFTDAALKHSEDVGSRSAGGDMGWLFEQELSTEPLVVGTLAKMAKGEISPVINSSRGFLILQMGDLLTDGPCPYEKASILIKNQLMMKKREDIREKRILDMKTRAAVIRKTDYFGDWSFR